MILSLYIEVEMMCQIFSELYMTILTIDICLIFIKTYSTKKMQLCLVDILRNVETLIRRTRHCWKKNKYRTLYVAFSQVKRQSSLKVLLPSESPRHSRNVVQKEILNAMKVKSIILMELDYEESVSYLDEIEIFNIAAKQLLLYSSSFNLNRVMLAFVVYSK